MVLLYPAADFNPVNARKHQVEDDEIGSEGEALLDAGQAVGADLGKESLATKS